MRLYLTILFIVAQLTTAFAGQEKLKKVVDLRGTWKFTIGDNPRWSRPEYNDHTWDQIKVPSPWEDQGFSGYDGYAWYRITLDLRNVPDRTLYLILGYIDDVDQVYFNGHLIGFNGSFPPTYYTAFESYRKYHIPKELINRSGKNVIAVRVYDTVREGGIIKGDIGIYANLLEPDLTYALPGMWKFKEGDNSWWRQIDYNDESWDVTMVPGFWKNMKKKLIEEVAWYRRQFRVTEALANEKDLVLVMGYIDDFDETYLNGVLIGATNDQLPLGVSTSWRTMRVYNIPDGLLSAQGDNVVAVRVYDIGINAGIYAGPLAIVPKKGLRQFLMSE